MSFGKRCFICQESIEFNEDVMELKHQDQPTFAHPLCYWKSTAAVLTTQLAKIEVSIQGGNATVAILVGFLVDLIEYAEMGANWAIANKIEIDPKLIDALPKRIQAAKNIIQQFKIENLVEEQKGHICTPGCRHK